MESPYSRFRGKRNFPYYDDDYEEYNGRQKRHMSGDSRGGGILPVPSPGLRPAARGETIFRLVCPETRVGCVIGKGGSIIKSLRAETGAKIMIADSAEGADDRVIFISSFDGDKRNDRNNRGNDNEDKSRTDSEKKEKEESPSPAQEALVKIHSHIIDGGEHNGGEEDASQVIITRLLVPNSQVGCLLGKGGRVIEQMREDTKTRIRILPRDQLPLVSLPFDEILQIVGEASAVKKAVCAVGQRLYENPAHEHIQFSSLAPPRSAFSRPLSPEHINIQSRSNVSGRRNADIHHHQRHFSSFASTETSLSSHSRDIHGGVSDVSWMTRGSKDEIVFRLLCPLEKIGGIIGRGGNVIRSLQEDTDVKIKILDPVSGSAERVIVISSVEYPDDDISPSQEALLHLQSKIADLGSDEDAVITSRLLVPSDLVGCLLGKGGSVITEMRRSTGANIRILGKDDLPKCALASDELVQIVGDIRVARDALIQVTGRLRKRTLEERHGPNFDENINASLTRPVVSRQNEFGSPNRLDFPRIGIESLGPPSTSYQASTSPWMGQDILGERSLRDSELPGAQQNSNFRVAGALVTRTTMEVVIPAHAITAIIGDGGSRIVRIRQISGAKVDLLDVRSGASEGVVKISGTPEQTQAAQNLLQELILTGRIGIAHGYSGEFYPS